MHICLAIMDMWHGANAQGAVGWDLGNPAHWSLGPGPGHTSIIAEDMCIVGNQFAMTSRYYIFGNVLNICICPYIYIYMNLF